MALMDILKDAYMWVSPMPNTAFAPESAVVVKNCSYANIKMRDLVICKKANETNRLIKEFLVYFSSMGFGGAVNYTAFILCFKFIPIVSAYPVLGIAAGSIAGLFVNFALSKFLIYRHKAGQ